jgi:3-oxoacyl-[acyl-carrier-protein] synthase II
VVVTGLGCVSPAGNDVPSTWAALLAGRSAVERLESLEAAGCHCRIGARVRDFDPAAIRSRLQVDRLGRCSQFALAAALEAWRDASLPPQASAPERAAAIVGTGIGDAYETFRQTQAFLEKGARGIHPLYVTRAMPNAASGVLSIEFGCKGPSFAVSSACASSGHAVALGARLIQSGAADLVVVGGTEDAFSAPIMTGAFDAIRALSRRNDDPHGASRPFERDRDGFVLGEGAGVLVLEEAGHALRRGARVRAEIAGAGMTSDAHHVVAPDPEGRGAVSAMSDALREAGLAPEDLQYVNAHGTSTPLNDRIEALALHELFGAHARRLAISATKSMIGHLLGASGALGLIVTVLSLEQGVVHPTINYQNPDPDCDLDVVPNAARSIELRAAIANSFGFGGHCVSIVARRFDPNESNP